MTERHDNSNRYSIKKGGGNTTLMSDAIVVATFDWGAFIYQAIIAGCAIGGLILSIKNYYDRKSDSNPKLKLKLEEWVDTTNFIKQKCIRCIIANTGRIPVKYENLGIFISYRGTNIELYKFKRVSISTEGYSATTFIPEIIVPHDSRMAIVHPQKIIQGLEENKIEERKIAIFVELNLTSPLLHS
jgi:hypothetical protein